MQKYHSRWYRKNRIKILAYQAKYRKENPEKIVDYQTSYKRIHRKELAAKQMLYHISHKKEEAVRARNSHLKKMHNDIEYSLRRNLRKRLWVALKRDQKSGSAIKDLGCSISNLKIHLEKQFKSGMTWENWSKNGWHIDHKIPLAFFNLNDRDQFLQACHYTNLQPLWAHENESKRHTIII